MNDVNEWLVTVLISARDIADEAGLNVTVERLDDVILTAANECEKDDQQQLPTEEFLMRESGKEVASTQSPRVARRYH